MAVSPSNTLVITGLLASDFAQGPRDSPNSTNVPPGTDTAASSDPQISFVQNLHGRISAVATIAHWAPLKSFRRIVAVFDSVEGAIKARALIGYITHPGEIESTTTGSVTTDGDNSNNKNNNNSPLKAYFAENTPDSALNRSPQSPTSVDFNNNNNTSNQLETSSSLSPIASPLDNNHLQLPATGRLFFISPPPSPPVGWASKLEDEPNSVTLCPHSFAEALHAKLMPNTLEKLDSNTDSGSSTSTSTTTTTAAAASVSTNNPGYLPRRASSTGNSNSSSSSSSSSRPQQLTRKVTLHNPPPRLSLDTANLGIGSDSTRDRAGQKLSPHYMDSPTIVLECCDDDNDHDGASSTGANDILEDGFDRMRSIRTEMPPTF